ncbi:cell division site-positioning protein MapZ family protein [Neobacillus sp. M.A.Huq-85]
MKKSISAFTSICLLILCFAINTTEAQAASYDKAYAAKTLVVKSSPGTSYKTLGKIKAGQTVKVYGGVPIGKDQGDWYSYQQYGWSKIKYKNKYAYVKTHQLSFANPYNWVPGIKSKTIKEIKKNYVSKKDKTKLVKSGVTANQGFYTMFIKMNGKGKWQQLVVINCKTGWYHG